MIDDMESRRILSTSSNIIPFSMMRGSSFPWITALLIASCLISTIPQFFLPTAYNTISGVFPPLTSWYYVTLNAFTHEPSFLAAHLVWIIAMFLVFGTITELVIGHSRFAIITLLTLFFTTLVPYLNYGVGFENHGASGIAWGYQVFYFLVLIVMYEKRGWSILKNGFVIASLLLSVFDWVVFPVFNTVVRGVPFYGSFTTDIMHLISAVVVVPLAFAWRKRIEGRTAQILTGQSIVDTCTPNTLPDLLLLGVLLLNVIATVILAFSVLS